MDHSGCFLYCTWELSTEETTCFLSMGVKQRDTLLEMYLPSPPKAWHKHLGVPLTWEEATAGCKARCTVLRTAGCACIHGEHPGCAEILASGFLKKNVSLALQQDARLISAIKT